MSEHYVLLLVRKGGVDMVTLFHIDTPNTVYYLVPNLTQ